MKIPTVAYHAVHGVDYRVTYEEDAEGFYKKTHEWCAHTGNTWHEVPFSTYTEHDVEMFRAWWYMRRPTHPSGIWCAESLFRHWFHWSLDPGGLRLVS
jgi:hypothetical protein